MSLTAAARDLHELKGALAAHLEAAKAEEARIRSEIKQRQLVLSQSAAGIDADKVALAKTIVTVRGTYARAGDDRASVISDAIKQLATGKADSPYRDLWKRQLGTKSYDRWHGQRCDCEYGLGPGHGAIIFSVGIQPDVRKARTQAALTASEIEACIYFLTNLERVQKAEAEASAQAAA